MGGRAAESWGRAVVVGGGFAGLVAARVLADRFSEVVVLEQDAVTLETGVHPHAPQARHAHAVLAKGAETLEVLFPGLHADLAEQGAPVFDYGERANFLIPTGFAPRCRTGVLMQSFTRDLLERNLRRRVLTLPQVKSVSGVRCEELTAAAPGRVGGVRYRPLSGQGLVEVQAELVVDATGRSGRLDQRLRAFGVHSPPPQVLDVRITYASVEFPRTAAVDYEVAYQMAFAPSIPRGGVLIAVEEGRWTCSLLGFGEFLPPSDRDGYLQFARSLGNPLLAEHLEGRTGDEPAHRYTNVNNRWNQYHRSRDWPERLVALGDAVCVFNPVYAQGLTVAALEARLLQRELASRGAGGSDEKALDGLGRKYQRDVARLVRGPWMLSANNDRMWDPRHQTAVARIAHAYNSRLFAVAVDDPELWTRFVRVVNMVASPTSLFHPSVLAKVLRPHRPRSAAAHRQAAPTREGLTVAVQRAASPLPQQAATDRAAGSPESIP